MRKTIVKIKNPGLAFQMALRYIVTKVNKTTVHCRCVVLKDGVYEDDHQGKDYKNQPMHLLEVVDDSPVLGKSLGKYF